MALPTLKITRKTARSVVENEMAALNNWLNGQLNEIKKQKLNTFLLRTRFVDSDELDVRTKHECVRECNKLLAELHSLNSRLETHQATYSHYEEELLNNPQKTKTLKTMETSLNQINQELGGIGGALAYCDITFKRIEAADAAELALEDEPKQVTHDNPKKMCKQKLDKLKIMFARLEENVKHNKVQFALLKNMVQSNPATEGTSAGKMCKKAGSELAKATKIVEKLQNAIAFAEGVIDNKTAPYNELKAELEGHLQLANEKDDEIGSLNGVWNRISKIAFTELPSIASIPTQLHETKLALPPPSIRMAVDNVPVRRSITGRTATKPMLAISPGATAAKKPIADGWPETLDKIEDEINNMTNGLTKLENDFKTYTNEMQLSNIPHQPTLDECRAHEASARNLNKSMVARRKSLRTLRQQVSNVKQQMQGQSSSAIENACKPVDQGINTLQAQLEHDDTVREELQLILDNILLSLRADEAQPQ